MADILPLWQRGLVHVQYLQTRKLKDGVTKLGWIGGEEAKALPGYLSQRQWKSVVNQVNAALESWLAGAQRGIGDMIRELDLTDEELRMQLYRINAYRAWWTTNPILDAKGAVTVSDRAIALAAELIQAWLRRHPFPNLSRVRTMLMDGPIAQVGQAAGAHGDYWVRVSTLVTGQPVYIPLHGYGYFDEAAGQVRNFCQVTVSGGEVSFGLVKKSADAAPRSGGEIVGADWGLTNVFTTSDGRILGQRLYSWLIERDRELTELAAALQRAGIAPSSCKRFRNLNRRIRAYVRNEVNRILNRLAACDIRELVVEALDFRMGGLSKRLNRIVTRAGRAAVKAKLADLEQSHGIAVTAVNPAYTSQECCGCGYVDERNRTSQKRFVCRFCGKKLLADINAARSGRGRSRVEDGYRYLRKERTLAEVDSRFCARWGVRAADLRERQLRGCSTASSP
ncbi:zinc ribbon domain-containing protein [Nocardia sp. IFM 10818]